MTVLVSCTFMNIMPQEKDNRPGLESCLKALREGRYFSHLEIRSIRPETYLIWSRP